MLHQLMVLEVLTCQHVYKKKERKNKNTMAAVIICTGKLKLQREKQSISREHVIDDESRLRTDGAAGLDPFSVWTDTSPDSSVAPVTSEMIYPFIIFKRHYEND